VELVTECVEKITGFAIYTGDSKKLLNTPGKESYDKRRRKFILEFADRIFRLSDPRISEDLREDVQIANYIA
jgi:hypothetical protein